MLMESNMVWLLWIKAGNSKLNITLPWDPSSLFVGIYPRKLKACVRRKRCTQKLVCPLFITSQSGRYPISIN